jgi:hypothetical protein
MRWLLTMSFFILYQCTSNAQWDVQSIPAILKNNSDAVIRMHATDVKVYESDKINVTEDIVITIMKRDILEKQLFNMLVRKDVLGNIFSIKVYDIDGRRVKLNNSFPTIEDIQLLKNGYLSGILNNFSELNCPFTVELEYKRTMVKVNDLDTWLPVNDNRIGVQNAILRIMCSDTTLIHTKSNNIQLISNTVDEDGYNVSLWELNNYQLNQKENRLEIIQSILPSITIEKRNN